METKEKVKLRTKKLKTLSRESLANIKGGGYWVYNEALNKWYWVGEV